MQRKNWTPTEDNYVTKHYQDMRYEDIAAKLGRTAASIQHRIFSLKLVNKKILKDTASTSANRATITRFQRRILQALKPGPNNEAGLQDVLNTPHWQTALTSLQKKGMVESCNGLFWLTRLGKQHTPCRNPHFAKKFGYDCKAVKTNGGGINANPNP